MHDLQPQPSEKQSHKVAAEADFVAAFGCFLKLRSVAH